MHHDPSLEQKDSVEQLPKEAPLHVIIPLFGAFNIFLMAFIAVMLT